MVPWNLTAMASASCGLFALRLEVERVARFELVEDKRTVVVLESGDIEREQIA